MMIILCLTLPSDTDDFSITQRLDKKGGVGGGGGGGVAKVGLKTKTESGTGRLILGKSRPLVSPGPEAKE